MTTPFRLLSFVLVIVVCFFSGCSYSYPVTFGGQGTQADAVSANTVNRRLASRSAMIITRDGRELSVSGVLLRRDSCLFTDTTGRASMPTADVLALRNVDRVSSAVGGLGLGFLGGFALGIGSGLLLMSPDDHDNRLGFGVLAIGTTVAGSLIGLGVGAARGTVTEYTLPESVPDSTQ